MSTVNNDPWNRGDDPLGDIASAIGKFRDDIKDDGPITIGVMRGSPVSHELLKMLDNIENVEVVIFDNPHEIGDLKERQRILLNDNNEFTKFMIHNRYYAEFKPEPVLVKSDNKPWYQDRKHFKNKKSRRKL